MPRARPNLVAPPHILTISDVDEYVIMSVNVIHRYKLSKHNPSCTMSRMLIIRTMDLPARIKASRKNAKLTQTQLALRIGVRSQAVNQWESGTNTPARDNLLAIAKITAAPTHWLMFGGPLPEQDGNGSFVAITHRGALVPQLSLRAAVRGENAPMNARRAQSFCPCGERGFFIILETDSNGPDLPKGSTIFFDPDLDHEPGNMVLAATGSKQEPVFGLLRYETTPSGTITIVQPLNPKWPQARSDFGILTIISKAIESVRGL